MERRTERGGRERERDRGRKREKNDPFVSRAVDEERSRAAEGKHLHHLAVAKATAYGPCARTL